MSKIAYKLDKNKIVLIEQSVLDIIATKKQNKINIPESGGVLIGQYREKHIYIFDLTTPRKPDVQKRTFFNRCSPHHNNYVQKCWANSGKTQVWIGEWHTHPENIPSPSTLDISIWKNCLPNRNMILIIQGITDIWLGYWNGHTINKLNNYFIY